MLFHFSARSFKVFCEPCEPYMLCTICPERAWKSNKNWIKKLKNKEKIQSEMTSYLNNGNDVMNYFAKFEKFLPHSIIIPTFMTVGSQMPELDQGAFLPPPPYKIGSQNTGNRRQGCMQ